MPDIYDLTLPPDPASRWNFETAPQPDVVLINLATNDFSQGPPDAAEWSAAYVNFVDRLRTHYPHAKIYLASGSMMSDAWPPGQHALSTLKNDLNQVLATLVEGGDAKVHLLPFDPQDGAVDGLGADYHPSLKTDGKMAETFVQAMSNDLGWTSVANPKAAAAAGQR